MAIVLTGLRFLGLGIFGFSTILFVVTVLNSWIGFAQIDWLLSPFWRVYLFFAVSGILMYILITFRRREGT